MQPLLIQTLSSTISTIGRGRFDTRSLQGNVEKSTGDWGQKFLTVPVQDIQTFASLGGDDHIVFNGPDEQFLGGRLMGAHAQDRWHYGAMPGSS